VAVQHGTESACNAVDCPLLFARFFRHRKGSVAPSRALGIVPRRPVAVDYSSANLVRTAMQNALDALMLSRDAQGLDAPRTAAESLRLLSM
jgi:hypothetical protein